MSAGCKANGKLQAECQADCAREDGGVGVSKRKHMLPSEHPWKYGLISGLLLGSILSVILFLERPGRAILPLIVLATGVGLVYPSLLSQLRGKSRPFKRDLRA